MTRRSVCAPEAALIIAADRFSMEASTMWFFRSRKTRSAARPKARRPSARLQLEALEDRCVPSSSPLDPTFGSGGIVTTSIGTAAYANAEALQPDGKILVGGT